MSSTSLEEIPQATLSHGSITAKICHLIAVPESRPKSASRRVCRNKLQLTTNEPLLCAPHLHFERRVIATGTDQVKMPYFALCMIYERLRLGNGNYATHLTQQS